MLLFLSVRRNPANIHSPVIINSVFIEYLSRQFMRLIGQILVGEKNTHPGRATKSPEYLSSSRDMMERWNVNGAPASAEIIRLPGSHETRILCYQKITESCLLPSLGPPAANDYKRTAVRSESRRCPLGAWRVPLTGNHVRVRRWTRTRAVGFEARLYSFTSGNHWW